MLCVRYEIVSGWRQRFGLSALQQTLFDNWSARVCVSVALVQMHHWIPNSTSVATSDQPGYPAVNDRADEHGLQKGPGTTASSFGLATVRHLVPPNMSSTRTAVPFVVAMGTREPHVHKLMSKALAPRNMSDMSTDTST
jgi:hypothetical protein